MNFALFFAWCKQHLLFYLTLLFLGFCVVVSVLPYAFMPDDSPNANTILPEIAAKPMGYKVDILYLKDANNINGEPSRIPLQSYNLKGDSLYYFALSEQTAHPIAVPKSMVTEVKSTTFPFGTDNFGRDMLSRLLLGTLISLSVTGIFLLRYMSFTSLSKLGSICGRPN